MEEQGALPERVAQLLETKMEARIVSASSLVNVVSIGRPNEVLAREEKR